MTSTNSLSDATADARPHSDERDARLDTTLDVLGNRPYRVLVRHFADSDGPLVVDDLVADLGDELHGDDRRLRARLHHRYLPKLDDAGLAVYDADSKLVDPQPTARLDSLLATIESFESADSPVSLDALLGLLADFRRRRALVTLLTHGDLSLPDLADEVAVAEYDEPLTRIDADTVLRVYLSLYHTHVPKLAEAGLAAYDQDADYVALTDAGRDLEPTVRSLCDPADK